MLHIFVRKDMDVQNDNFALFLTKDFRALNFVFGTKFSYKDKKFRPAKI